MSTGGTHRGPARHTGTGGGQVARTVGDGGPTEEPGSSDMRTAASCGTVGDAGSERRRPPRKDGLVPMWQRILDRIAPVMEEDLSELDRRDGVGGPVADRPSASVPVHSETSRR